jgi:hypothetical protein
LSPRSSFRFLSLLHAALDEIRNADKGVSISLTLVFSRKASGGWGLSYDLEGHRRLPLAA